MNNTTPTTDIAQKADLIQERTARHPFVIHAEDPHHAHVLKREKTERRFRRMGVAAVAVASLFLIVLLTNIVAQGITAFVQTRITLEVFLDRNVLDAEGTFANVTATTPLDSNQRRALVRLPYQTVLMNALQQQLKGVLTEEDNARLVFTMLSKEAVDDLRQRVVANPGVLGQKMTLRFTAASWVDMVQKGHIDKNAPQERRPINDRQLAWIDALDRAGKLHLGFNHNFFTSGDSREPEQAGIKGAALGSLMTILICMLCAFPLGVSAAVYLEEFARKNKITDAIELSISNLAAVPSIVYGLLGLSVYLNVMELPRSSSLVGGMTLALLVLPVLVVASRNALKSVPPSIKDAAIALGASPLQVALHHTLPAALPGIMTGTILSIARALGETAPLLMIGMVAFVADIPHQITEPAAVLPVQVYLWSDSPEMGFQERTSAAILVLLVLLLGLNTLAAWIRKKYEVKW